MMATRPWRGRPIRTVLGICGLLSRLLTPRSRGSPPVSYLPSNRLPPGSMWPEPDHRCIEVLEPRDTEQPHRPTQLRGVDLDRFGDSGLAAGHEPVEVRSAHEAGTGAESDGGCDVGTRPHAGVDHHVEPVAHDGGDLREHFERNG